MCWKMIWKVTETRVAKDLGLRYDVLKSWMFWWGVW
jgi:hypothetical protein